MSGSPPAAAAADLEAVLDDALGDFDAPLAPPEAPKPKKRQETTKTEAADSSTSASTSTAKTAAAPVGGLGPLPPRKPAGSKTSTTAAGKAGTKGKERASSFNFGAALASGGGSVGGGKDKAPPSSSKKPTGEEDPAAAMLAALMSQLGAGGGGDGDEGDRDRTASAAAATSTLAALAEQLSSSAEGHGGEDDPTARPPLPEDLISRLEATLDRLQAAGEEAKSDEDDGERDGTSPSSPPSSSSLTGFAAVIMRQMLAKEVMYQPMKEIGEKYPSWLSENAGKITERERERFEAQRDCVRRIVAHYESDSGDFDALFCLLQEMQAQGQPPQELVDELAPGLSFGEDGMPKLGGDGGAGLLSGLGIGGGGASASGDACCLM